jgi:hypothetical protein
MDNKQIDRQELDDYITQEPDYKDDYEDDYEDADEYYRYLNSQIVDIHSGPVKPYSDFQCWIGDLAGILGNIRRLLWKKCPDNRCRTTETILWFRVGKHKECIPF